MKKHMPRVCAVVGTVVVLALAILQVGFYVNENKQYSRLETELKTSIEKDLNTYLSETFNTQEVATVVQEGDTVQTDTVSKEDLAAVEAQLQEKVTQSVNTIQSQKTVLKEEDKQKIIESILESIQIDTVKELDEEALAQLEEEIMSKLNTLVSDKSKEQSDALYNMILAIVERNILDSCNEVELSTKIDLASVQAALNKRIKGINTTLEEYGEQFILYGEHAVLLQDNLEALAAKVNSNAYGTSDSISNIFAEIASISNSYTTLLENVTNLTNEYNTYTTSADSLAIDLQGDIASLREDDVNNTLRIREDIDATVTELLARIDGANTDITDVNALLEERVGELNKSIGDTRDTLQRAVETKDAEIGQLGKDLDDATEFLKGYAESADDATKAELNASIEVLENLQNTLDGKVGLNAADIETLQNTCALLDSNIDSNGSAIQNLNTSFSAFKDNTTTVTGELRLAVQDLNTASGDLQTALGNLKTHVDSVEDALTEKADGLDGRLTTAESGVNNLNSQVSELSNDFTDTTGELDNRLTTAESGVNTLNSEVSNLSNDFASTTGNLDTRVTGTEGDIGDLQTQLNALSTQVQQCFQSASDGKSLLASTLTGYGISTVADATYATINNNINSLASSKYQAGVDSVDTDAYYNTGYQAGVASVDTQAFYNNGYNAGKASMTLGGTAAAQYILKDYTVTLGGTTKITGTMANNGALNPAALAAGGSYSIPAGYTSGGTVTAASLASQTSGTAGAADIRKGKTAWVGGYQYTGTLDPVEAYPFSVKLSECTTSGHVGTLTNNSWSNLAAGGTNTDGHNVCISIPVSGLPAPTDGYSFYVICKIRSGGNETIYHSNVRWYQTVDGVSAEAFEVYYLTNSYYHYTDSTGGHVTNVSYALASDETTSDAHFKNYGNVYFTAPKNVSGKVLLQHTRAQKCSSSCTSCKGYSSLQVYGDETNTFLEGVVFRVPDSTVN